MAKWFVKMYQSVPVFVEVEADTPEQASKTGEEAIRNGEGRVHEHNIVYHPTLTVFTENWVVAGEEEEKDWVVFPDGFDDELF